MIRFELYEDAEQKFRWRAVAKNGEIVGDSGQGYSSKSNARRALLDDFLGPMSVPDDAPVEVECADD